MAYHTEKFKINRLESIAKCSKTNPQKEKSYTTDWFTGNSPRWSELTKGISGKENIKCLEVGSWEGKSSEFILNNICNGKNSSLVAIDTWMGSVGEKDHEGAAQEDKLFCRYVSNTKEYSNLEMYRGASYKVLASLNTDLFDGLVGQYDFIYIDGSHWAKDVLGDAVLGWELLKKGGLMMFDDYNGWRIDDNLPHTGPGIAIDSFLQSYLTMYKVLSPSHYQMHILKISDVPLIATHEEAENTILQQILKVSYEGTENAMLHNEELTHSISESSNELSDL